MLRVELSCPSSIGTVPLIKLLSMYLRGVGRAHDTRHGQRQAAWGESSVASIVCLIAALNLLEAPHAPSYARGLGRRRLKRSAQGRAEKTQRCQRPTTRHLPT